MRAHKIKKKLSNSVSSLTGRASETKEEKCTMERKKRVIKKTWKMKINEKMISSLKVSKVKVKRKPKKTRKNYTIETVKTALKATQEGLSHKKAAKVFGIPETTLRRKSKYPDNLQRWRHGTVLKQEEEQELIHWIDQKASSGCPATKKDFMDTVEVFVKNLERINPFTNGRPGRHWFEGFIRRHPNITFSNMNVDDEKTGYRLRVNHFCEVPVKFEEEDMNSLVVAADPLELVESCHVPPFELVETGEIKDDPVEFSAELEAETNPNKNSGADEEVEALKDNLVEEIQSSKQFLEQFEKRLPKNTLEQFQNHEKSDSWTGAIELRGLYEYWFKLTSP